jgi:hypothetical protein
MYELKKAWQKPSLSCYYRFVNMIYCMIIYYSDFPVSMIMRVRTRNGESTNKNGKAITIVPPIRLKGNVYPSPSFQVPDNP